MNVEHETSISQTQRGYRWSCSCGQAGRIDWTHHEIAGYQALEHVAYMAKVARLTAPREEIPDV